MDNIVRIRTNVESNAMDMEHLEAVLKDFQHRNVLKCVLAARDEVTEV